MSGSSSGVPSSLCFSESTSCVGMPDTCQAGSAVDRAWGGGGGVEGGGGSVNVRG
jgi:hypothetical protein